MAESFSVLLPVYAGDDAAYFRRAVAAATVEQELPPSQLVVVQDGPLGEALAAVVDELEAGSTSSPAGSVPVRVVRLPRNVGLAGALQAGLAACEHEIVARVDADDVSLPRRFALQVPRVAEGLDLLGSAITEFTEDETDTGLVRRLPLTSADIAATARFRDPFNHPTVVYRRSAVVAAGGYRHVDLMEDYWLFARMIANGAAIANLPDSLVLYRVGAGAYARRGGLRLLRAEIALQRELRRSGFTSRGQALRNVVVRGGYRLVPERLRRLAYRRAVS